LLCRGLRALLIVVATASDGADHATDRADHPSDRAAQHATDGTGGLVALARALLRALHQPLRMQRRRQPHRHPPHAQQRDGAGNETQSRLRARDRFRTAHYLVSSVDPEMLRVLALAAGIRGRPELIAMAANSSTALRRSSAPGNTREASELHSRYALAA